jgi:serine/threonine protein kinase
VTVSSLTIGQVLGHYRIVEQIGAGGMGIVFRARDEQLDRDVALKTLPQLALLSDAARRQFRREALSLAKITDPHVAMAFDFGRDCGIDYLVTEYVPGLTVEAMLAGRPLPEIDVFNLGKQLASGLVHLEAGDGRGYRNGSPYRKLFGRGYSALHGTGTGQRAKAGCARGRLVGGRGPV